MRIVMAQSAPVLGDIDANVDQALKIIDDAGDGIDLVVFPELFLTGADIGNVQTDLGMGLDDPRLGRLLTATENGPAVCVGFIQAGRRMNFFNSAAYLEGGSIRHAHRKTYRVTYHVFEEGKYFSAGDSMQAFDTDSGRMGMLVCNDAWQPPLVFVAVQDGAEVLLVPSNSGDRTVDGGDETRAYWRQLTRFYASMFQCYVVFVNRVGEEAGMNYWGGSHVVDPWGAVVQEAPLNEASIVPVDLDLSQVRKRRRQVPFLKESRLGLLAKELNRLVNELGDE
ncbi:MAG: nitrilase-related carbon-nitrogen hydrolase [Streptosporangiales bacterium]